MYTTLCIKCMKLCQLKNFILFPVNLTSIFHCLTPTGSSAPASFCLPTFEKLWLSIHCSGRLWLAILPRGRQQWQPMEPVAQGGDTLSLCWSNGNEYEGNSQCTLSSFIRQAGHKSWVQPFTELFVLLLSQELPDVSPMQAVAFFLQFVPLEGELHDFFRPVSSQILHLLKGKQCLPTEPGVDVA